LRLVRQHFNAIRLLGGPVDPIFFELCNHLGLLVLVGPPSQPVSDWQTAEGKGGEKPWRGEPWLTIQKDRLLSQVTLLKNQPCILAWVTTNQPFAGDPLHPALFRDLDSSRPLVQFAQVSEEIEKNPVADQSQSPISQILAPGFSLQGGGTHSMMQSLTNEAIRSRFSGLVLGSWQEVIDQIHTPQGRSRSVALAAIRQAGRPAEIKPLDLQAGHFQVKNRMRTLKLDLFRLHWQIVASGRLVLAGELDLPPALPGETADLSIPYAGVGRPQNLPCLLQLTVHQIDANLWCPADQIVSTDSFELDHQTTARDPFLNQLIPVIAPGRNRLR